MIITMKWNNDLKFYALYLKPKKGQKVQKNVSAEVVSCDHSNIWT